MFQLCNMIPVQMRQSFRLATLPSVLHPLTCRCFAPIIVLFHLQDVNIGLFEHHIRGGLPMASLGAGGRREVAALPPSLHAHAATAAVSRTVMCVTSVGLLGGHSVWRLVYLAGGRILCLAEGK
jgi:hypothetical protein